MPWNYTNKTNYSVIIKIGITVSKDEQTVEYLFKFYYVVALVNYCNRSCFPIC